MRTPAILFLAALASACSHRPVASPAVPSSPARTSGDAGAPAQGQEGLQDLPAVEVHVDFTDSGIEQGRMYVIEGEVFSNKLEAITRAEILVKDDHAWNAGLVKKDGRVYLDVVVPFRLSVAYTKIRFHLADGRTRDVGLFCTRPGKCL